jgi:hypothetical protein
MKIKIVLIVLSCTGLLSLAFVNKNNKTVIPAYSKLKVAANPVAILELFTSEGCISCPSADRLLPELAKLDSNIITLSFHVDYWDRLGWKDPFSSRDYSDRQKEYGKYFKLTSIYTPQLVVNGEYELVGNVRSKAELTIKKALAAKSTVSIKTGEVTISDDKIRFKTTAAGEIQGTELQAALVQKNAVIKVDAGENTGATLTHTNIVRSFVKQTTAAENEFQLQLPKSLTAKDWLLVVYARQKSNLKITGAVIYQPE